MSRENECKHLTKEELAALEDRIFKKIDEHQEYYNDPNVNPVDKMTAVRWDQLQLDNLKLARKILSAENQEESKGRGA